MYYSNTSISSGAYSNLQSAVYGSFDNSVFTPKYKGLHNISDFYQKKNIKDDYKPKQLHENKDVVFVDDMSFDLFLRFSPLLRSIESKQVKELYTDFLEDKGNHLLKYLKQEGLKFISVEGFARMKLEPNAIAAVVRTGDRAILAINLNFDEKIFDFAKHNRISIKEAFTYVFAHETVHLAGVMSESATEKITGDFFKSIDNSALTEIAYRRSAEISS